MTLTGSAGISFELTDTDSDTGTGTVEQVVEVASTIGSLTVDTDDIVYSITGSVGTTAFDLNLNDVNIQSGTGYATVVVRNNNGDFTTLKMLVIHNTHASQNIVIGSPAANSLLTWGATNDTLTIPAGGAFCFLFSSELTISTNGKLNIVGSSAATTFKAYVFGA